MNSKCMMFNKKGQTTGLITGLVFGITSLIIGIIIALVIISTLGDADLLTGGRTTASIANETGAFINATGYQLAGLDTNFVPGTISITFAFNDTSDLIIPVGNYSISSAGILLNATDVEWSNVSVTYASSIQSSEEVSTTKLRANFTAGVDNVSAKIPTVLLVAAIVMILGVLALLVGVWQKMRLGGGGI